MAKHKTRQSTAQSAENQHSPLNAKKTPPARSRALRDTSATWNATWSTIIASQHPANTRRANTTRQISQTVRNTGTPSLAHGTEHEQTPSRNLAGTKSHSTQKSEHGTGQLDTPQSATSSHRRAQLAHSGTVRHAANKSTAGRSTQHCKQ
jgi:hypothetical protein